MYCLPLGSIILSDCLGRKVGHPFLHNSEKLYCEIHEYGGFETRLFARVLEESSVRATSGSLGSLEPQILGHQVLLLLPWNLA